MNVPEVTQQRFWAKVNKCGPVPAHCPELGPCWIWMAGTTETGYGRFTVKNRTRVMAYRFAHEIAIGPFPEGFEPDHICRVRRCVNPSHLRPLTHRENTLVGTSFSATNAAKTYCDKGHPLSGENLYVNPSTGGRVCRQCSRKFRRDWEERMDPESLRLMRAEKNKRHYERHHEEIVKSARERMKAHYWAHREEINQRRRKQPCPS